MSRSKRTVQYANVIGQSLSVRTEILGLVFSQTMLLKKTNIFLNAGKI